MDNVGWAWPKGKRIVDTVLGVPLHGDVFIVPILFQSELGLLNAQVEQPFKENFVGMVHFEQVVRKTLAMDEIRLS